MVQGISERLVDQGVGYRVDTSRRDPHQVAEEVPEQKRIDFSV